MSDFRITYPGTVDTANYVSQQMQVAHVRVRSDDDPQKQEQIVAERKQQITQFLQFCDNQHRLSGRDHTHYRVSHHDVDLQYINNNGQPLVYVDPPVGGDEVPDDIVIETVPPTMRATAVLIYSGRKTTLTFSGGGSVGVSPPDSGGPPMSSGDSEQPDPASANALIYFDDAPDELVDSLEGFALAADQVDVISNPMEFVGIARGAASVDELSQQQVFLPFAAPIPIFAGRVSFSVDGTEDGGGGIAQEQTTIFASHPVTTLNFFIDQPESWPLPGPIIPASFLGEGGEGENSGLSVGDPAGRALSYSDDFEPIPNFSNPATASFALGYNVFEDTVGAAGAASWDVSASLNVSVYLVDALDRPMRVATGSVRVSGVNKYVLTPASRREAGGRHIVWSRSGEGWGEAFKLDPQDFPEKTTDGGTSKKEGSDANVSVTSFDLDLVAWESSAGVSGGGGDSTVERVPPITDPGPPEDPNPPPMQPVTSVGDEGFLPEAAPTDVKGSVTFEFASTPSPILDGWYFSTDFGGGVTWGASLL